MFLIAELLERAKAKAGIDSDYRLAKVIGITHAAISNYRVGKSLPNARILEQLCALSGDDAGLIVAQVEAARAAEGPVRNMWLSVAKRLQGAASTAILSVCFAISLIAMSATDARATTVQAHQTGKFDLLYIVSTTILSVGEFLQVRLRRWQAQFAGLWRLSFLLQ